MYYLIKSKNNYNKFIKIYDKKELFFLSEKEFKIDDILCLDDELKTVILNNIEVFIFDLSKFIENETKEWESFYTLNNWENIFWLFGYDFSRKDIEIWNEITDTPPKKILFYIQNISFLVNYIDKGFQFKRFYQLCNYYNENILKKEKNKIFVDIMEKYKEEWIII